jgi:hypothetical protein
VLLCCDAKNYLELRTENKNMSSVKSWAASPRRLSVRFEYPLAILFAVTKDMLHLDLQNGGMLLCRGTLMFRYENTGMIFFSL